MKNGILLVDKPEGKTSYDVVRVCKKIFKTTKIGHAGTLDPFATGLLIIAVGKATRILEYISGDNKVYEFEIQLGITTDSFDITGKILKRKDYSNIKIEDVLDVLNDFKGEILQVPPIFSAKKMNGERLYEKARRGEIINIPPSKVTIHELELLDFNPPKVKFRAKVSKGTYIRSLSHDIGIKLGCGATTTYLRRIKSGKFDVSNALKLNDIDSETELISVDDVLDFPKVFVKNEFLQHIYNGQSPKANDIVRFEDFKKNDIVKLSSEDGRFLAIGISNRNSGFIEKMKLLHPNEGVIKIKKVFKDI